MAMRSKEADREALKAKMRAVLVQRPRDGSSWQSSYIPRDKVLLMMPTELWPLPLACLDICTRVRIRGVCSIFAAAARGPAQGGVPLPEGHAALEGWGSHRIQGLLTSPVGQAILTGVKSLTLVSSCAGSCGGGGTLGDRTRPIVDLEKGEMQAKQLRIVLPPMPALEALVVRHSGLRDFEAPACPALRHLDFDWDICSCSLRRFRLVAGKTLVTLGSRPEMIGAELFSLEAPELHGLLDLNGLEAGVQELVVHCPSNGLQVLWPDRRQLRGVRQLDVHTAAPAVSANRTDAGGNDSGGALDLGRFTGLRALSVCTQATALLLPQAAVELRELRIKAPRVRHLDLSEWTAFGELRTLDLQDCQTLQNLHLPLSGELRVIRVQTGDSLHDLRLHLRAAEELSLQTPGLQRLQLTGCKGLQPGQASAAVVGCPALKELVLAQCIDLQELSLTQNNAGVEHLRLLDLGGMSRVHHLSSLHLEAPRLERLVMPPLATGMGSGLRRVVLHCPTLTSLDLSTIVWAHIEEIQIVSAAITSIAPPKPSYYWDVNNGCTADPNRTATPSASSQAVQVHAPLLSLLDLSGAQFLVDVDVNMPAPGVRVLWPRFHQGRNPLRLALALPGAGQPLPPPSGMDAVVTSVNLAGCGALPAAAIAAAVSRWPQLASLDLGMPEDPIPAEDNYVPTLQAQGMGERHSVSSETYANPVGDVEASCMGQAQSQHEDFQDKAALLTRPAASMRATGCWACFRRWSQQWKANPCSALFAKRSSMLVKPMSS